MNEIFRYLKDVAMPTIEIRGLKKSFETKQVLLGISMLVNKGDSYGFLGPNGSGKTTTLHILLGILRPDEGEVSVLGMNPAASGTQLRSRVNALPESHGYRYPSHSASFSLDCLKGKPSPAASDLEHMVILLMGDGLRSNLY